MIGGYDYHAYYSIDSSLEISTPHKKYSNMCEFLSNIIVKIVDQAETTTSDDDIKFNKTMKVDDSDASSNDSRSSIELIRCSKCEETDVSKFSKAMFDRRLKQSCPKRKLFKGKIHASIERERKLV